MTHNISNLEEFKQLVSDSAEYFAVIYKACGWTWGNSKTTPSADDIRQTIRGLLNLCVKDYDGKYAAFYTGGFGVVIEDGFISLDWGDALAKNLWKGDNMLKALAKALDRNDSSAEVDELKEKLHAFAKDRDMWMDSAYHWATNHDELIVLCGNAKKNLALEKKRGDGLAADLAGVVVERDELKIKNANQFDMIVDLREEVECITACCENTKNALFDSQAAMSAYKQQVKDGIIARKAVESQRDNAVANYDAVSKERDELRRKEGYLLDPNIVENLKAELKRVQSVSDVWSRNAIKYQRELEVLKNQHATQKKNILSFCDENARLIRKVESVEFERDEMVRKLREVFKPKDI